MPLPPGELSLHIVPHVVLGGELDGETEQGAIVRRVDEDSPAAAAGLRKGDVITAIEGDPVKGRQDLADAVAEHKPGDEVTLTVYQSGEDEEREVTVTLAEHPEEEETAYLGVWIGGFFRLHRLEDGDGWPHGIHLSLDSETLPEELPFDLDGIPYDFEFHFPPEPFDGGETDCCGGSI